MYCLPVIDSKEFKAKAAELGIAATGIVRAAAVEAADLAALRLYLKQGRQGSMSYLENHLEKRSDPRLLEKDAESIIVILVPYKPLPQWKTHSGFALYAQGKDYHKVVKKKLDALAALISPAPCRCFCDTAPILEKYWARQAGLGYIGRNTLLIHPVFGSWCFIGAILTRAEFSEYDAPLPHSEYPDSYRPPTPEDFLPSSQVFPAENVSDHPCLSCRRCIDICPGNALFRPSEPSDASPSSCQNPSGETAGADTGLDARRCFSYLTIENKGECPPVLSRYWYGCDLCQSVCPANANAAIRPDPAFEACQELLSLDPDKIERMQEDQFDRLFAGSAVRRTGLSGLKRNIRAWKEGRERKPSR